MRRVYRNARSRARAGTSVVEHLHASYKCTVSITLHSESYSRSVMLRAVFLLLAAAMADAGREPQAGAQPAAQANEPLLALPDAPSCGTEGPTTKVEVGGSSVAMDHLGPMIGA